jgi:hypothetical protein
LPRACHVPSPRYGIDTPGAISTLTFMRRSR